MCLKQQYVVTYHDKVFAGCSRIFDSNNNVLPGFAPKAKNRSTIQELPSLDTLFLIQHFDSHKSTTLGLAEKVLLEQFPDLEDISIPSLLWKHAAVNCTFLLKGQLYTTKKRYVERILRLLLTSKWKEIGVNF